jgi:hypothetical protein
LRPGWAAGTCGTHRTDNSVKNHFFAKLRKAMRRINRLITEARTKQLKEVKLNLLYKIIEASEERFKKNPLCTLATSTYACSMPLSTKPSKTRFSSSPMTHPTPRSQTGPLSNNLFMRSMILAKITSENLNN